MALNKCIYFLFLKKHNCIKIGSTKNLLARRAQHRKKYGQHLLLGVLPYNEDVTERKIHRRLAQYRWQRGELYTAATPLLAFIKEHTTSEDRLSTYNDYLITEELRDH